MRDISARELKGHNILAVERFWDNTRCMNLDYVYQVDHMVCPGETEATGERHVFLGGKGMNQSCALAKAGVEVYHAGLIGPEGGAFLEACHEYGVHVDFIKTVDAPTGHTIIQLDKNAQNSILLFGGANRMLTEQYVDEVLSYFNRGDVLLLQNEVNLLPYIVNKAYEKGMQIALNPSPYNEDLEAVDLNKISIFLLNEVEGGQVTGKTDPEGVLAALRARFPKTRIMLTLGMDGSIYADEDQMIRQPVFPVKAVDTTAAGDTFTGYFLAGLTEGMPIPEILQMSAKVSAIAVSRAGAVPSIPWRSEVAAQLGESRCIDGEEKDK